MSLAKVLGIYGSVAQKDFLVLLLFQELLLSVEGDSVFILMLCLHQFLFPPSFPGEAVMLGCER